MKTISDKYSCTTIAFICILACWLVPSSIWASVEVDGIYYDLNTSAKTAAVASNPNYYTGAIDIPTSIVYNGSTYNVKSIGSRAFLNCSELISITFPNSVTTIGSSAFERCTGLTEVVIGGGATSIDYEAFKNCSNLRSLTLPSSLKTIENETFSGCTSLSEIIAKRTTPPTIVSTTFDGIDKTDCIVFVPEGCKSSYANATHWKTFSHIDELTVVATGSCGENVTYTIYSDMTMVISGTGNMYHFNDPNYSYPINTDYQRSIKKVIIEEGVTSISQYAFYGYAGMTSVTIPNSVTEIGYRAFLLCKKLASVTIPQSVIQIDSEVFCMCPGLSRISVSSDNAKYDSRDNCNAIIETSTNTLIYGCINTVIPNSVTSIGSRAFLGCSGLTLLPIPNNVTEIGWSAFCDCTSLTSMTIPNGVSKIEESTFYGCEALAFVEIGSSVASIDRYAFQGCISLTSVTIPSSMKFIDTSAFNDCINLASINIDTENSIYDSRDNCNAVIYTSTNTLVLGCKNTVIPNSVMNIGESAFHKCTNLSAVTIPSSVIKIGQVAFYGCSGLASIIVDTENAIYDSRNECNAIIETTSNTLIVGCKNTIIPNSVTAIGYCAFSGCSGLSSVTIPKIVTTIQGFAFEYCTGLTSITIPSNVTIIGSGAFYSCTGLRSVICESETPITLPKDGLSISAFSGVDLTSCTLYVPKGSKSAYENADGWNEFQNIEEVEFNKDTDISTLNNAIYVEKIEGRIGGTTDISVKLKNNYPVRGFQFTLELPEGTSINSWSLSTSRLPSGATLSDKIATQKIEGNKITVACSLNYGDATFTGNDGEIATVNVTFGDDMEVGTYPIYLTACDVTTASGVDEDLSDVKATLVLEDYVVGDANGDGKVRIGDATTILNYIVGAPSDNFKEKAADANGDGKIRIGDATTILNIIVNQ